jgi:hypothetical protein
MGAVKLTDAANVDQAAQKDPRSEMLPSDPVRQRPDPVRPGLQQKLLIFS